MFLHCADTTPGIPYSPPHHGTCNCTTYHAAPTPTQPQFDHCWPYILHPSTDTHLMPFPVPALQLCTSCTTTSWCLRLPRATWACLPSRWASIPGRWWPVCSGSTWWRVGLDMGPKALMKVRTGSWAVVQYCSGLPTLPSSLNQSPFFHILQTA